MPTMERRSALHGINAAGPLPYSPPFSLLCREGVENEKLAVVKFARAIRKQWWRFRAEHTAASVSLLVSNRLCDEVQSRRQFVVVGLTDLLLRNHGGYEVRPGTRQRWAPITQLSSVIK
jgi:hypothetical protein